MNPNDRSSSTVATIVVASRDRKDRTPMRYFRPVSCAHAAMGSSVAATPPRSVMNSRRCMSVTKLRRPYRNGSKEHLDRAETRIERISVGQRQCRIWAKSAVLTLGRLLPVYPCDRTSSDRLGMSQTCEQQT